MEEKRVGKQAFPGQHFQSVLSNIWYNKGPDLKEAGAYTKKI